MDIRFYYYRDHLRRPLVTLARIQDDTDAIGYGWSVCSAQDQCNKSTGKKIAQQRAYAALNGHGVTWDAPTICRWQRRILREEAVATLWRCKAEALLLFVERGDSSLLPRSMRPFPGAEELMHESIPREREHDDFANE